VPFPKINYEREFPVFDILQKQLPCCYKVGERQDKSKQDRIEICFCHRRKYLCLCSLHHEYRNKCGQYDAYGKNHRFTNFLGRPCDGLQPGAVSLRKPEIIFNKDEWYIGNYPEIYCAYRKQVG